MKKSKKEIIDETVEVYSKDPSQRGFVVNAMGLQVCKYLTDDGRMCAVGRCLIPNQLMIAEDQSPQTYLNSSMSIGKVVNLEEILKEEYRGHDIQFWKDLQQFHDCVDIWYSGGLNVAGELFLARIYNKYENE